MALPTGSRLIVRIWGSGESVVKAWSLTIEPEQLNLTEVKVAATADAVSGERCNQFKREYSSRPQRHGDVSDDLLCIRCMLVTQWDQLLSEPHTRIPYRLFGLVLPLYRGAGVPQQLHQPFHLCRQVSWVPDGCQTLTAEGSFEQGAGRQRSWKLNDISSTTCFTTLCTVNVRSTSRCEMWLWTNETATMRHQTKWHYNVRIIYGDRINEQGFFYTIMSYLSIFSSNLGLMTPEFSWANFRFG